MGPRAAHAEACRARLEGAIAADEDDDRTKKVQERQDHFAAQKVAEGDEDVKRGTDPRPEGDQEDAPVQEEDMNGAERFNIGSPAREKDGGGDDLEDAHTLVSERRVKTPVRPPASKRRSVVHDEEPDTKRIILGDMSEEGEAGDEDIGEGIDGDSIQVRREDERILHGAWSVVGS